MGRSEGQGPLTVGWIADYPSYRGGAELTASEFLASRPDNVRIRLADPENIPTEVDCYVVHNCVDFNRDLIPLLRRRPFLKYVHDLMPHGDRDLRAFLLGQARWVVFTSRLHHEKFTPHVSEDMIKIIPPFIDRTRFRSDSPKPRSGTCHIGWFTVEKGARNVIKWAETNDEVINVYGRGPDPNHVLIKMMGPVEHDQVPAVLAQHARFVHLPSRLEPFGRGAAEAYAAGCEVVTNHSLVGAVEYFQNPYRLDKAAGDFWELVLSLV